MITYMIIKNGIEKSYDLEELSWTMIVSVFTSLLDLVFILFQPLFYLIYKLYKKGREW